jgi:Zn-finger nucleic acid-binding protein
VNPYREASAPDLTCPRCGVGLTSRAIADARVDECSRCAGVFVPSLLMPRVTDALDLAPEVIAQFPEGTPVPHPGGPMYVKCPRCRSVMNRRLFAPGARVVVDECRGHGVWFDDAELRAVADFVADGGMERARKAEAAERARRPGAIKVTATASGLTDEWSFWSLLLEAIGLR